MYVCISFVGSRERHRLASKSSPLIQPATIYFIHITAARVYVYIVCFYPQLENMMTHFNSLFKLIFAKLVDEN